MYENEFRKDFIYDRGLAYGTVVSLVMQSLKIVNDPHAEITLKRRHLNILSQVKQLLAEQDRKR
jgi:hypothetical protein